MCSTERGSGAARRRGARPRRGLSAQGMCLRACYAMSGTDIAVWCCAPTRAAVLTSVWRYQGPYRERGEARYQPTRCFVLTCHLHASHAVQRLRRHACHTPSTVRAHTQVLPTREGCTQVLHASATQKQRRSQTRSRAITRTLDNPALSSVTTLTTTKTRIPRDDCSSHKQLLTCFFLLGEQQDADEEEKETISLLCNCKLVNVDGSSEIVEVEYMEDEFLDDMKFQELLDVRRCARGDVREDG
eukprot:3607937-Rhodomonas_salina.1